ncbi:unnamed protein product [Parajaminaea phylloscopi]
MPNIPALSSFVQAVTVRPGLLVPHLVVATPASISWYRAHALGVRSVIFDKDNCLTSPYSDRLAPALRESYEDCLQVFGKENVLIVSNSAGCSGDTVGAQVLSRNLQGTTVLCHPQKKPGWKVARQVVEYLDLERRASQEPASNAASKAPSLLQRLFWSRAASQLPPSIPQSLGHVMVIGDRITTDSVLAHRIQDCLSQRQKRIQGSNAQSTSTVADQAIAVLTTHLWAEEGAGNRFMRRAERAIREAYTRRGIQPGQRGWKATAAAEDQQTGTSQRWNRLLAQEEDPRPDIRAAELSQPSRSALPDPTPALFLSSEVRRLQVIPPLVKRGLLTILNSRALAAVSIFFRDGWLLIIRGCKEGLNSFSGRPQTARGAMTGNKGPKSALGASWTTSALRSRTGTYSTHALAPQTRRGYATSPRPTGPRIPMLNWIASFAAVALIPIGFLLGSGIHEATHDDPKIEEDVVKDELKADGAAGRERLERARVEERAAQKLEEERKVRHLALEKLERRRHELEWELRDVGDKLAVVQARVQRQRERDGEVQQ